MSCGDDSGVCLCCQVSSAIVTVGAERKVMSCELVVHCTYCMYIYIYIYKYVPFAVRGSS